MLGVFVFASFVALAWNDPVVLPFTGQVPFPLHNSSIKALNDDSWTMFRLALAALLFIYLCILANTYGTVDTVTGFKILNSGLLL